MRSCGWLILKLPRERSVWQPQYLLASTWSSPKASLSVLVLADMMRVVAKVRVLFRAATEVFWATKVGREAEQTDEAWRMAGAALELATRAERAMALRNMSDMAKDWTMQSEVEKWAIN